MVILLFLHRCSNMRPVSSSSDSPIVEVSEPTVDLHLSKAALLLRAGTIVLFFVLFFCRVRRCKRCRSSWTLSRPGKGTLPTATLNVYEEAKGTPYAALFRRAVKSGQYRTRSKMGRQKYCRGGAGWFQRNVKQTIHVKRRKIHCDLRGTRVTTSPWSIDSKSHLVNSPCPTWKSACIVDASVNKLRHVHFCWRNPYDKSESFRTFSLINF